MYVQLYIFQSKQRRHCFLSDTLGQRSMSFQYILVFLREHRLSFSKLSTGGHQALMTGRHCKIGLEQCLLVLLPPLPSFWEEDLTNRTVIDSRLKNQKNYQSLHLYYFVYFRRYWNHQLEPEHFHCLREKYHSELQQAYCWWPSSES